MSIEVSLTYDDIIEITKSHEEDCVCKLCCKKKDKVFSIKNIDQLILYNNPDFRKKIIDVILRVRNNHFTVALKNVIIQIKEIPRIHTNKNYFNQYTYAPKNTISDGTRKYYDNMIYKGNYYVSLVGKYTPAEWKNYEFDYVKITNKSSSNMTRLPLKTYDRKFALNDYRTREKSLVSYLNPQDTMAIHIRRNMDKQDTMLKNKAEQISSLLSCNIRIKGDID